MHRDVEEFETGGQTLRGLKLRKAFGNSNRRFLDLNGAKPTHSKRKVLDKNKKFLITGLRRKCACLNTICIAGNLHRYLF